MSALLATMLTVYVVQAVVLGVAFTVMLLADPDAEPAPVDRDRVALAAMAIVLWPLALPVVVAVVLTKASAS